MFEGDSAEDPVDKGAESPFFVAQIMIKKKLRMAEMIMKKFIYFLHFMSVIYLLIKESW